ncbi:MAG: hypothetical protein DMD36_01160, partial [Gemmatimonadetes bacterium]
MTSWLVRRVAASIAIVFAVVTVTFVLIHLAHGTPFLPTGERPLSPEVIARLRAQFGLDRPLPVQYVKYLAALLRGQLGESFALRRPVWDALADAIPHTLTLAGASLFVDFLLVHALRNALLPVISLLGLAFPFLLTGAVLVEWVFAWPGMGRLTVSAILQRDYPVVTATALAASVMVVL